jgi:hypothetical protein
MSRNTQEPIEKFWMVWGVQRGAPRYQHRSKAAAQSEARRLADEAPGELFVVLAAVDAFIAPVLDAQTVRLIKPAPHHEKLDEVPF